MKPQGKIELIGMYFTFLYHYYIIIGIFSSGHEGSENVIVFLSFIGAMFLMRVWFRRTKVTYDMLRFLIIPIVIVQLTGYYIGYSPKSMLQLTFYTVLGMIGFIPYFVGSIKRARVNSNIRRS